MDRAGAATLGYLAAGVVLTRTLEHRGHRQMCQVARCRAGRAAWLLFTLHLWVPRWDPVRIVSSFTSNRKQRT